VRKIVALSEIYGTEPVARAIEDAFIFEAFSSEYIANLLQQCRVPHYTVMNPVVDFRMS
jgi:hypothetical protein